MLANMHRTLEEISLMGDNSIAEKNSFIVQQIPEIRQKIIKGKNWDKMAKYQLSQFFDEKKTDVKKDMESLMKLYGSDVFEQFDDEPKCA